MSSRSRKSDEKSIGDKVRSYFGMSVKKKKIKSAEDAVNKMRKNKNKMNTKEVKE